MHWFIGIPLISISSIYIDDDNVLQMYSKHLPLSKLASLTNKDLNGDQINNVVLNKDNKKLIVVLNKDVYICDYDGLISEDNDTDLLLDSNSIKILEPPNTQTSSFLVNVKAFTYQNTETNESGTEVYIMYTSSETSNSLTNNYLSYIFINESNKMTRYDLTSTSTLDNNTIIDIKEINNNKYIINRNGNIYKLNILNDITKEIEESLFYKNTSEEIYTDILVIDRYVFVLNKYQITLILTDSDEILHSYSIKDRVQEFNSELTFEVNTLDSSNVIVSYDNMYYLLTIDNNGNVTQSDVLYNRIIDGSSQSNEVQLNKQTGFSLEFSMISSEFLNNTIVPYSISLDNIEEGQIEGVQLKHALIENSSNTEFTQIPQNPYDNTDFRYFLGK